jgi:hypothetical protein
MERLGDFLFKHVEGIAAYCDHPMRTHGAMIARASSNCENRVVAAVDVA